MSDILNTIEKLLREVMFNIMQLKTRLMYSPCVDGPIHEDIAKLDVYILQLKNLDEEISKIKSYL